MTIKIVCLLIILKNKYFTVCTYCLCFFLYANNIHHYAEICYSLYVTQSLITLIKCYVCILCYKNLVIFEDQKYYVGICNILCAFKSNDFYCMFWWLYLLLKKLICEVLKLSFSVLVLCPNGILSIKLRMDFC